MRAREIAVAIGYEPDKHDTPRVLASGFGEIANHIMATAREHDIHIHADATLAPLLAQVPVGSSIPEEAYQLVAELPAFLCRTDTAMAAKISGDGR